MQFWFSDCLKCIFSTIKVCTDFGALSLQWHHNDHDGVLNHQPYNCLLNCLFRCRSKKTSKLWVTCLCAGNWPVTGEFPTQRASNAENVSIWWRHHDVWLTTHCMMKARLSDVFFDLCLNKRLSEQSWGWWFEMPSCSLWRPCNEVGLPTLRKGIFLGCCHSWVGSNHIEERILFWYLNWLFNPCCAIFAPFYNFSTGIAYVVEKFLCGRQGPIDPSCSIPTLLMAWQHKEPGHQHPILLSTMIRKSGHSSLMYKPGWKQELLDQNSGLKHLSQILLWERHDIWHTKVKS